VSALTRGMFTLWLVTIVGLLVFFIVVGVLHR
jgi:hypothetical protein